MKKVATIEIWADETLDDVVDCVNDVYVNML